MSTNDKEDEALLQKIFDENQKNVGKVKLRYVSLEEVCSDHFDEQSDNTVLRFVILHIRKAQLKYVKTFGTRPNKWNINPTIPYDRIVTCADLNSVKGTCFCIIYSTQRESDYKLQKFKINNCGVGMVGEMIEPLFTGKTLGASDVPILEHKHPLVCLEKSYLLLKQSVSVDYTEDNIPTSGTKFFHLKNIQLNVQNLTMEDPICTGYMCDRQGIKTMEGMSCGCLVQSDGCNVVLCCNVFFRNKEGKLLFSVRNFRSWAFTKLLCGNSLSYISTKADYVSTEAQSNLRRHMSIILDYVNCANGWSVIGWFRVGMLQDAADTAQDLIKSETEKISAETVTPHISRLWPTEVDEIELRQFQVKTKIDELVNSKRAKDLNFTQLRCDNCQRCSIRDFEINIISRPTNTLNLRRRLCLLVSRTSEKVHLCENCNMTLLLSTETMNWSFIWPSYFWKLMSDNITSIVEIWKWIPQNWRPMWMDSLTEYGVQLEEYSVSYFSDISIETRQLEQDLASMTLIRLKDSLNRHPYCSVKCPWGCDEFPEICKGIPLYAFISLEFSRSHPTIKLPLSDLYIVYGDEKRFFGKKNLIGLRPDYPYITSYMLDNPKWPIRPCLRLVEGKGPMVLVCPEHEEGSTKKYFHVPINPINGNLPSVSSPKFAHATITPRTIQSMKIHKFSNTYQLVNTEANFGGIDSCYLTEQSHFDTPLSSIGRDDELLFLSQRKDMKARLNYLIQSAQFPYAIGNEKLKIASNLDNYYHHLPEYCLQGSTYLSLFDTLLLEKHTQQSRHPEEVHDLPWPPFVIICHPKNKTHGYPILCPTTLFSENDFRLLWIISCIVLNNNIFWMLLTEYSIVTEEDVWTGWLLKTLSSKVLNKVYRTPKSRYNEHISIRQIVQMTSSNIGSDLDYSMQLQSPVNTTFRWRYLSNLLNDVAGIYCLDVNYEDEIEVEDFSLDSSIQIFIIFNFQSSTKTLSLKVSDNFFHSNTTESQHSWTNMSIEETYFSPPECTSTSSFLDIIRSNSILPLQLNFENSTYELSFVASSNEYNSLNPHWDANVKIRRMFYESFNTFWNVSRHEEPFVTEEYNNIRFFDYNMILYTKRPQLKDIQETYLLSMGNCCLIKCPTHHKHLVTSTYRYSKSCSFVGANESPCHRYNAYICPVKYCTFSLCKKHLQPLSNRDTNESDDEDLAFDAFRQNIEMNEKTSLDEATDSCIDSEIFPPFLITDTLQNADSVCSSESHFTDDISVEDQLYTYNYNTTEDHNDTDGDDDVEYFSTVVLPTTDSSKIAHWMKEPIGSSIPLSVLLNKHLRLLIRRNFELKATKRAKGFLERIVSTLEEDIVPLLYPEGMVFPHIFFYQSDDGSIVGSIPAPLWNCESFCNKFSFASIVQHMRNRITNSSLRCSTEPTYLFFAFDAISNCLCHHDYPQLVLTRGYEHMLRNASIHGFVADSFQGHKDVIDPRKTVQELAAFLRDHDPTYFYTHTCNAREHFGVAPLQLWVDFQVEELRKKVELSEFEFEKLKESYNQRLTVPLCRSWFRAGNYYMKYICESPEQPLGPIRYYWYRWEDNDETAALQHLHSILCSSEDKNNPEDLKKILSRVICSSRRAIQPSILHQLFEKGLLERTEESVYKYYSLLKKVQEHGKCSDRNYSCHRQTGIKKDETQCRVTHHGRENPRPNEYSYVHINANHSEEAKSILQDCALLSEKLSNEGAITDIYSNPMLNSGKYYYPAEADEHLIPFNPFLFSFHLSSDCVEVCNRAMSSHYLAKYNALVDKHSQVTIRPTKEFGKLTAITERMYNTKISTTSYYQRMLETANKEKEGTSTTGRKLGLPQAIALMLQIPQIYTNVTFEHIPTTPLEQRPGILIKPLPTSTPFNPYPRYQPLNEGDNIPDIIVRQQLSFPVDRQFSPIEQIMIKDILSCPDSIDKITLFGIRPPELRFVRSIKDFYQWFTYSSHNQSATSLLNQDFFRCPWINGIGRHVQIRRSAIPFILRSECCPLNMRVLLYSLLRNEQVHFFSSAQHDMMKTLFLSTNPSDNDKLPLVVISPVKPTQTNRFLIHLLLSLGSYSNEAELFNVPSIIESFRNAKLLPNTTSNVPLSINDVLLITKKYIEEQLFFLPSGTKTFDRYVVAAYQTIRVALLEHQRLSFDIPSFLYTSLVIAADQQVIDFRKQLTYNIIETLKTEPYAPNADLLHNATKTNPLVWRPYITKLNDQSVESYSEHLHVAQVLQQSIDNYIAAGSSSPSCIIIIGGPGTGKTFQLKQACLYALSQGLNVLTTAVMSERAIVLGCRHLHYLFCVPASENQDIHQLTDNIVKNLNRKPAFLYTLETNDAVFIDEAEFASAQFFNALDNVLRYVRKKNTFFGGMMVFATMDVQQLPPIQGHPCLISSLVLTSFHLVTLNKYMRSRADENLQRMITLTRKLDPLTEDEMREFVSLIITYCTFVDSWEDPCITPDTIRILGTRKGVQTAETAYYDKIQSQGLLILTRTSEDYESLKTSHGTWKSASTNAIHALNKLVREPEILKLHQGLIVEATFNNGTLWSNGQIALITELPHPTTLQQWKPFPILLAPPGVRSLPSNFYTLQSLKASGWKTVHMKTCPDLIHHCQGGLFAKRYQYGIRPMAATTIHKAMGNDYDKIVSSVCDDGISGFRLWEKAQVLVLISRVHRAKDIIFVGDKMETAQKLLQLVSLQPKYALYMNYIINCLTNTSQDDSSPIINFPSTLPFHLCAAEYPKQDDTKNGYVYLLISIPQPNTTYIGQTQNLHDRINRHNKGWAQHWTNSITLRPWTCMAYVVGFQSKEHRIHFETLWQNFVQTSYPNLSATPLQILHIGELAVSKYHEQYNITADVNKLRIIQILSPKIRTL